MNRIAIGAAVGTAFACAAAAGTMLHRQSGEALHGSVTVKAAACAEVAGFDDVREGAVVRLTDPAGTELGRTTLRTGRVVEGGCRYRFELRGLATAPVVHLAVGTHQGLALTAAQLEATDRTVDVRLGAPTS